MDQMIGETLAFAMASESMSYSISRKKGPSIFKHKSKTAHKRKAEKKARKISRRTQ
jgi:hypothetical protein